jgi:osmotically-inducible protein OsmY
MTSGGGTNVARTHGSIGAFILVCIATFIIGGATACENTARGVKQDAREAEVQTRDERAEAETKAREVGRDAAKTAERVAGAAAQAGEELAERASAMKETADVKASLMADPSVDATRIDVDTDAHARTITLKGFVPTPAERERAATIAASHAEGYKVVNNLAVQPR